MKTKAEFKKEVVKEIKHLLNVITKEQRDRLNILTFKAENIYNCVYGQLTGNSYSNEAKNLYKRTYYTCNTGGDNSFEEQDFRKGNDFTALEKYILMVDTKMHEHIIKYLKGEIKTLKIIL